MLDTQRAKQQKRYGAEAINRRRSGDARLQAPALTTHPGLPLHFDNQSIFKERCGFEFMLIDPNRVIFRPAPFGIAHRRHDRATPRPVRKTADGTSNQRSARHLARMNCSGADRPWRFNSITVGACVAIIPAKSASRLHHLRLAHRKALTVSHNTSLDRLQIGQRRLLEIGRCLSGHATLPLTGNPSFP
jgi:hypothetical protein